MRAWCCKIKLHKIIIPLFICLLLSSFSYSGTGSDSFAFLKIKSSARSASLGDGFVSIPGDVNASSFNPASISALEYLQVSVMHLAYIADTSYEALSLAAPVNKNLSLGASVTYFSYGSIAMTSESGTGIYSGSAGSFTPSDMLGMVTLGYKLSKNLGLGINAKYATEDIGGVSINALMADAGLLFSGESFGAGLSVSNIGSMANDLKTPVCVRGGVSLKTDLVKDRDLLILLGGNYGVNSGKTTGSAGVEYCYDNTLSVRGSYTLNADTDNINAGAGFKGNMDDLVYSLDYNFSIFNDLGSAHRISLTVGFGEGKGQKSSSKRIRSNAGRYSTPVKGR